MVLLFANVTPQCIVVSGESFISLAFQNRLGASTVGEIVPETAAVLYEVLKDDYLKVNVTTHQLQIIHKIKSNSLIINEIAIWMSNRPNSSRNNNNLLANH